MALIARIFLTVLFVAALPVVPVVTAAEGERVALEYAAAAPDNPLKGLVPYKGEHREKFPHSMEFSYFPVSAVAVSPGVFKWDAFEAALNEIAGRGHHAVVRFFLEYPGKKEGVPEFLLNGGLKVHTYVEKHSRQEWRTPDYSDAALRALLKDFIAAWGAKYDGDPRLGFITAGLLGAWGEWHTYPREDLYASKEVEAEVLAAYEAAFKKTPVLVRYPAGTSHAAHAPNSTRCFGYHDDSFAWATLETGKSGDEWFYMRLLKDAGAEAQNKWKSQPIGGEIRPEAWGLVFDATPGKKEIQNFRQCVVETHASWLMDSGMFDRKQSAERIQRATVEVQRMGYEFHIPGVTIARSKEKVELKVEIENRGVAPFYFDWPAELGLIGADGAIAKTFPAKGRLNGLLPGEPARIWNEELELKDVSAGKYKLALRLANVLKNGPPVRFANKEQDRDVRGWVSLGEVEVR